MNFQLTTADWLVWFIIPSLVTLYVSTARNDFQKGTNEHTALRVCRIGLALLSWSFGFGLIGFAFVVTAFVLGIVGIVKGRTMYGIVLIMGSVVLPVISIWYTLDRVTSLLTQQPQQSVSSPTVVKPKPIRTPIIDSNISALADHTYSQAELRQISNIVIKHHCSIGQACWAGDYHLQSVDLNGDGNPEYIVAHKDQCGSAGCREVLLASIDGEWRQVANLDLGAIKVTKDKTGGMNDIEFVKRDYDTDGGNLLNRVHRFAWDGAQYRLISTWREQY